MNEELIEQVVNEAIGKAPTVVKRAAMGMAIRLYHVRHVAPLARLLERCRDREHNPFEGDNQTDLYRDICAALAAFEKGEG